MAASALFGASAFGGWSRLAARQKLTQEQLLDFDTFGTVTLIHVTDIHGQLKPIYYREPSINLGVGANRGVVPHVTGADFRRHYGISDGQPGPLCAERRRFLGAGAGVRQGRRAGQGGHRHTGHSRRTPGRAASGRRRHVARLIYLLPHGRAGHGQRDERVAAGRDDLSLGVHRSGSERVRELVESLPFAALGQNIFDAEWDEPTETFAP